MLYCLVCFYNEDLSGNFTIDYMFKDKKLALDTLIEYNKIISLNVPRKEWMQIYFYEQLYIPNGDDEDYYVYLSTVDKKIKIFVNEQNLTEGYNFSKLPLPPIQITRPIL